MAPRDALVPNPVSYARVCRWPRELGRCDGVI